MTHVTSTIFIRSTICAMNLVFLSCLPDYEDDSWPSPDSSPFDMTATAPPQSPVESPSSTTAFTQPPTQCSLTQTSSFDSETPIFGTPTQLLFTPGPSETVPLSPTPAGVFSLLAQLDGGGGLSLSSSYAQAGSLSLTGTVGISTAGAVVLAHGFWPAAASRGFIPSTPAEDFEPHSLR